MVGDLSIFHYRTSITRVPFDNVVIGYVCSKWLIVSFLEPNIWIFICGAQKWTTKNANRVNKMDIGPGIPGPHTPSTPRKMIIHSQWRAKNFDNSRWTKATKNYMGFLDGISSSLGWKALIIVRINDTILEYSEFHFHFELTAEPKSVHFCVDSHLMTLRLPKEKTEIFVRCTLYGRRRLIDANWELCVAWKMPTANV